MKTDWTKLAFASFFGFLSLIIIIFAISFYTTSWFASLLIGSMSFITILFLIAVIKDD